MNLRTIAILRGGAPADVADLAERCWSAGIDLVEVPVQTPEAWDGLRAVAERSAGRAYGAGTVLTTDDVGRAAELGASVIVSPVTDPEVVAAVLALGLVPLPGVMTPGDVALASAAGVRTCKLFPASVVGPGMMAALRGPFPTVSYIAVGGIDAGNAEQFLRAGARGVAFGSSITEILALDDPVGFVGRLHSLVGSAQ